MSQQKVAGEGRVSPQHGGPPHQQQMAPPSSMGHMPSNQQPQQQAMPGNQINPHQQKDMLQVTKIYLKLLTVHMK